MTSATQRQVEHLHKEIAKLHKKDADLATHEANLAARVSRANAAVNRATNANTVQSKLREIEGLSKRTDLIKRERSEIARKLADRAAKLHNAQRRQTRDDDRRQQRLLEDQRQLLREQQQSGRHSMNDISTLSRSNISLVSSERSDFFISHASEDKGGFVQRLAEILQEKGCVIWYDDVSLKPGDSLRRSIDAGLAGTRFGIVVLSKHFFRKEWPQRELDGLVAREVGGEIRIFPIWHEISKDEVARHSPTLADKVALNTSLQTVEEIASELYGMLGER